jgi:nitroimidazol reductase NimA-like FMN-containing flavoprotein (pyridoxamine 5'-phosphate oxidase superfamily)
MPEQQATIPQVSRIRRHAERAVPDDIAAILSSGLVAHVGVNDNGEPLVIPFAYHYDADRPDVLYLHGAVGNHILGLLAKGAQVCVEVTTLDGLVYSRSAPNHSMNFRSAVCLGRAEVMGDDEKQQLFAAMTSRYFAGRTLGQDYAPATDKDLHTVTVVAVHIEKWAGKARCGGPLGPLDDDADAPGSAGVVELGGIGQ